MTKRTLIVLTAALICPTAALAQLNCNTNTKLICLIPVSTNVTFNNGEAASITAAQGFNGPIGSQLSQLPSAASAPGLVVLFDASGNPVPYENLGPILVDRPDPVSPRKLTFGFSFQQFNFDSVDGISLRAIPFTYPTTSQDGFTKFVVSQTEHVSFKYNQYVLLASYGLPKNTDITLAVPFSRVSLGVYSTGTDYLLDNSGNVGTPATIHPLYVPGSASGIGDVSLSVKHLLYDGGESRRISLAAGFTFRFPSGEAENYLGAGAYGMNLFALASYKARISPHVRIANQWNTDSILVTNNGKTGRLPGGIQYAAGVDAHVLQRLTASVDILGSQFVNCPSFSLTTYTPQGGSALPTVAVNNSTYTTANVSSGIKWRPFKKSGVVVYGNVLTQVHNVGLRTSPVPSGGISYNFTSFK